jgi:hypothetical protein
MARLDAYALAVAAVLLAARAERVGALALTLTPDGGGEPAGGGMTFGGATAWDDGYVGGEVAFETHTSGGSELAVSYHVLAGRRAPLSERWALLVDAGAGVSQQVSFRLGLFGDDDGGFDTEAWTPSAALRGQLVAELGVASCTHVGVALSGDARAALDGSHGAGLGLGFVFTR